MYSASLANDCVSPLNSQMHSHEDSTPRAPETSDFGKHMIAKWFLVALPALACGVAVSMPKYSDDKDCHC